MPTKRKPKVGDLVRLDPEARTVPSLPASSWQVVGLVVECVGIRCKVNWTNGVTTRPWRDVLEVINGSR